MGLEEKLVDNASRKRLRWHRISLLANSVVFLASCANLIKNSYERDWTGIAVSTLATVCTAYWGWQAGKSIRKLKQPKKDLSGMLNEFIENTTFLEEGLLAVCIVRAEKSLGRDIELSDITKDYGKLNALATKKSQEYFTKFDECKSKGDMKTALQYFAALETLYTSMRVYHFKVHRIVEHEEIVTPRDRMKRSFRNMDETMRTQSEELQLCYGYEPKIDYDHKPGKHQDI